MTPVRSQDNYSTCWIMAAIGSLESAAAPQRRGCLSTSPRTTWPTTWPRGSTTRAWRRASWRLAYYARWEGPVLGVVGPVPAPRQVAAVPARRAPRAGGALPAASAQGPLDNDAVKWAVMTYGGVDAAVDFRRAGRVRVVERVDLSLLQRHAHARSTTTSSSWAGTTRYPAAKLPRGVEPPGDGAFLIKNSWGTDFARPGLLCGSPTTTPTSGEALAVFSGVEPAGNYDAIYQYDALGRSALDHRRRRRAGVVRQPLHRRRHRPRGGGLVLRARAGHGVRGARRARPAGCRRRAGRRRRRRSPWRGTTRCAWRSRPR